MEYLLVSLYNSDTYIWFCAKDKLKRKDKLIKLKHTIKHAFERNCQCTGLECRNTESHPRPPFLCDLPGAFLLNIAVASY